MRLGDENLTLVESKTLSTQLANEVMHFLSHHEHFCDGVKFDVYLGELFVHALFYVIYPLVLVTLAFIEMVNNSPSILGHCFPKALDDGREAFFCEWFCHSERRLLIISVLLFSKDNTQSERCQNE